MLSLLLPGALLYAKPVTPEKALQVASKVFASSSSTKASSEISSLRIVWDGEFEPATKAAQEPAFYVITRPEGGFVMVSGNDNVTPVLGFSFENDFRVEGMPGNVRAWMEQYKAYVRSTATTTPEIQEQWERYEETKAHADPISEGVSDEFLASRTVQWNQTNPANFLCPDWEWEEGTSVCGCTALAIAEVIVWFGENNPASVTGVVPEYTYTADNGVDVTVPAHALGYEYDWTGMQNVVSANNFYDQVNGFSRELPSEQLYAILFNGASRENPYTHDFNTLTETGMSIAHLVYDIATLLKSMFNYEYGTSASIFNAPPQVSPAMGYNKNARYVEKDAYTGAQWEQMIKDQVDQHPLVYIGFGESGGHAYVADGYAKYEGRRVFHFNMGWGGLCNGYYNLDIQDDFNLDHAALFDFYPAPASAVALPAMGFDAGNGSGMQYVSGYNTGELSFNLICFRNLGTGPFTGEFGAAVEDYSGTNKVYVPVGSIEDLGYYWGWSLYDGITVSPGSPAVFGDKVTMYYQEEGKDKLPCVYTPQGVDLFALPFFPAAAIKKAPSYHVNDYFVFEIFNNSYVHHSSRWRITKTGGASREYSLDDYHAQLTEAGEYKIEATIYDADDPNIEVEKLITYITVE